MAAEMSQSYHDPKEPVPFADAIIRTTMRLAMLAQTDNSYEPWRGS